MYFRPCVREISTRHAANAVTASPYFSDRGVGMYLEVRSKRPES